MLVYLRTNRNSPETKLKQEPSQVEISSNKTKYEADDVAQGNLGALDTTGDDDDDEDADDVGDIDGKATAVDQ